MEDRIVKREDKIPSIKSQWNNPERPKDAPSLMWYLKDGEIQKFAYFPNEITLEEVYERAGISPEEDRDIPITLYFDMEAKYPLMPIGATIHK